MLIIMTFAVLALYATLIRHIGKSSRVVVSNNRGLQENVQTENPVNFAGKSTSGDTEIVAPAWTALDDLQLNRLLKESF